jgi:hypothetical protein
MDLSKVELYAKPTRSIWVRSLAMIEVAECR